MRGTWAGIFCGTLVFLGGVLPQEAEATPVYSGKYIRGEGDTAYLELLDIARRMLGPDPEFQHLPMLYTPAWNGLVEGPTWDAWWIQNSYGPTYCALPFYEEPLMTFLQNAQDLWFSQMGDGQRKGVHDWVAPDGALCDCASPGRVIYKQGDGRIDIHDWGLEFTAAGIVMQAELLLIRRAPAATAHYLPMLERAAEFVWSRRDPKMNLFLAGPAANLLAPSYAGWLQPDGAYGMAYLTGLSITYIAALDRLVEVAKMAGYPDKAAMYTERREKIRSGLVHVTTDEGYFIKSLDPDGTRHGVYGAAKHGYFEASPNHDAICFNVVDDTQARRIYDKIAAIPLLRRHHVIIANEPGLDDMYVPGDDWLWQHGTWVNGGHWSTCEARMVMAYCRLGKYDDARKSMEHMLGLARQFRMDNPLVEFGSKVYQPNQPINLCYDSFGPPAALLRGLFEYRYHSQDLTIIPRVPPAITRLEQHFPVVFGSKRVYVATQGAGPVTAVRVNGKDWPHFDAASVTLPFAETPDSARVFIALGGTNLDQAAPFHTKDDGPAQRPPDDSFWKVLTHPETPASPQDFARAGAFLTAMQAQGLGSAYEARHARLIVEYIEAIHARRERLASGAIAPLPEATSQSAADQSYEDTLLKLLAGLAQTMQNHASSGDEARQRLSVLWDAAMPVMPEAAAAEENGSAQAGETPAAE